MDQPNNARPRHPQAGLLVAATLSAALVAACSLTGAAGSGPVTGESRQTETFTRIDVGYGIGLAVEIGPTTTVDVEAQQDLLPLIETSVDGGTLHIRGTADFSAGSIPRVVVTTPSLEGVALSGGSQGRVDGLASPAFDIKLSGGSGLTATGSATTVSIHGTGGSTATLREVAAMSVSVELSGGSVAQVTASEQVSGGVSGGARIVVGGDAQVDVAATGGGEVDRE